MSAYQEAFARAVVSGTIASVASTATLTLCGWLEQGRPAAPNNGPSQWIWGERAAREKRLTVRETVVGYGVHHASSIFWAVLHERVFGASTVPTTPWTPVAKGLATAACALFVDYKLTPHRFRPGFDKHLSRPSIALVYTAFGVGLAARELQRLRSPVARRARGVHTMEKQPAVQRP